MRFLIITICFMASLTLSVSASVNKPNSLPMQADTTLTLPTAGNCGMCRARIEEAANIPGVTKASWDELCLNPNKN